MSVARVRLIHWKAEEAAERTERLRKAGFEVDFDARIDGSLLSRMRAAPPDAVVIDLGRLPSHGREVATGIRATKALRPVPIVFVDGSADKVEAIRALLPDAAYTTWPKIRTAVRDAIAHAPTAPVQPVPMMERYGGRSVAQKLGVKEGSRLAVWNAPRGYLRALDPLPAGVTVEEDPAQPGDTTLWFVHDAAQFHAALRTMVQWAAATRLWVLWPKQAARKASDLNQTVVRESAIAVGLVDYKVCAYDAEWSALAFALKKANSK